jgi:hypothetical protein
MLITPQCQASKVLSLAPYRLCYDHVSFLVIDNVVPLAQCYAYCVRKNPHAVALGRRGGKATAAALTAEERSAIARKAGLVGGQARTQALTPEARSKIAMKAAKARWKKQKPA